MAKSAKYLVTYSSTPIAHQLEADDDGGGAHPIGHHETNMVSFRTGVDFSARNQGHAGKQGTKAPTAGFVHGGLGFLPAPVSPG